MGNVKSICYANSNLFFSHSNRLLNIAHRLQSGLIDYRLNEMNVLGSGIRSFEKKPDKNSQA
jgi:hypothetical protein